MESKLYLVVKLNIVAWFAFTSWIEQISLFDQQSFKHFSLFLQQCTVLCAKAMVHVKKLT
jgi:hypothetical protein